MRAPVPTPPPSNAIASPGVTFSAVTASGNFALQAMQAELCQVHCLQARHLVPPISNYIKSVFAHDGNFRVSHVVFQLLWAKVPGQLISKGCTALLSAD